MVAEGREPELASLCLQDALFVIPRMALRPGTLMVRGKFVDDMRLVVSRGCPWRQVARDAIQGLEDDRRSFCNA